MSVGTNIRTLRKKKGLTQKQLGELCGMADSAIRFYESDRGNPTHKTLERIAAALNVHVLDLVGIGRQLEQYVVDVEAIRPISGNPADVNSKELTRVLTADVRELYDGLTDEAKAEFWRMAEDDDSGPDIDNPRARISTALDKMNDAGQARAADAVEDLAGNPKYQRTPAPQSTPAAAEGKDTPTPQKPSEGG